nr:aminotransferase class III-fold pyridoxal phosphate-dependent enzyme [Pseudomonadota bacterium]
MNSDRSRELLERALKTIPGGVNSPVRAYGSVGGTPRFIEHGKGSRVFDVDGNEYIDYVGSWGPLIVGHANPAVLSAVRETMDRGTSFGAPTEIEIELAVVICKIVPSIEKVRMVSSVTESPLRAILFARSCTVRDRVLNIDSR